MSKIESEALGSARRRTCCGFVANLQQVVDSLWANPQQIEVMAVSGLVSGLRKKFHPVLGTKCESSQQ